MTSARKVKNVTLKREISKAHQSKMPLSRFKSKSKKTLRVVTKNLQLRRGGDFKEKERRLVSLRGKPSLIRPSLKPLRYIKSLIWLSTK